MANYEPVSTDSKRRVFTDLGIDIDFDFPDEVADVIINRALYTASENAKITRDSAFFGKRCVAAGSLTICGIGQTNVDAEMLIRLEDFICLVEPEAGQNFDSLEPPLYFVATPMTSVPALITFEVESRPAGEPGRLGLDIKVRSWEASGDPKPKTKFQWHCCVKYLANIVG